MIEHDGKTAEDTAYAADLRWPDARKLAGRMKESVRVAHRPRNFWEVARSSGWRAREGVEISSHRAKTNGRNS